MSSTPAERPARWLAVALTVTFVVLIAALHVQTEGPFTIDSVEVAEGADALVDCIGEGTLTDCEGRTDRRIGPYASLRYITAVPFRLAGTGPATTLAGLIVLSGLAFAALLALAWIAGVRAGGRPVGAFIVMLVVTGPLLWYAHSAYGEVVATLATELLVVALWLRWPPWVAGVAFAATLASKETALPFALVLAAAAVWARPGERRLSRGELVGIACGAAAGIAMSVGMNVFRYGSIRNEEYLRPEYRMPGLGRKLEYFAALFVSPNGGILWFWLTACATLVAGLFRRPRLPALAGAAVVLGVAVGLANWWQPFGWDGWGPRLLMPWVLPAATLVVLGHAPAIARASSYARPRALAAAACAVALAGLPHLVVLVDSSRYRHGYDREYYLPSELVFSLFLTQRCPGLIRTEAERDRYLPCLHENAWERKLLLPRAYARAFDYPYWRYTLLFLAATGSFLWLARSRPKFPQFAGNGPRSP